MRDNTAPSTSTTAGLTTGTTPSPGDSNTTAQHSQTISLAQAVVPAVQAPGVLPPAIGGTVPAPAPGPPTFMYNPYSS